MTTNLILVGHGIVSLDSMTSLGTCEAIVTGLHLLLDMGDFIINIFTLPRIAYSLGIYHRSNLFADLGLGKPSRRITKVLVVPLHIQVLDKVILRSPGVLWTVLAIVIPCEFMFCI